jgi:hypothetical protein
VLGVLLVVWVRRLHVPAVLVAPLGQLAGASLWIYLTHWQVYPHLEVDHPFWATTASLVVGVLAWRLVSHARSLTRRLFERESAPLRA